MRLKTYKPALLTLLLLSVISTAGFAQDISLSVTSSNSTVSLKAKVNEKNLKLDDLGKNLKQGINTLSKNISLSLDEIVPKIDLDLDDIGDGLNLDINPKIDLKFNDDSAGSSDDTPDMDIESGHSNEKQKTYSKTYPLDGNDKIKLDNEFGKIVVNTWDRHEVKVDAQIKAWAKDDNDAQRLLDGVQINDSKQGDVVSYRTETGNPGNWHGGKVRKVEIDYTVYMPARTDLDVENSFGSIVLPDLGGKIDLSSSYGNVEIANLSNPANDIQGSYGNLKAGSLNGAKLEFSYGNVAINECTNLRAQLSYGTFQLGKLRGAADLDLSNVGGFKIGEIAASFKKLNINSSYSSVALGVSDYNNFNFDITTTYGGFSYNDNKVTITSKTPPDGSRYFSNTKNYKGHFGKSSDAQISIHSSYGGVNFE